MKKATYGNKDQELIDGYLIMPLITLLGCGLLMVYSSSSQMALERYGSELYFVKKQALFTLIGGLVLITCSRFPYKLFRYLAYGAIGITIVMLGAVLFSPLAHKAGGAVRWLNIAGFKFQPAEFAKFALVLFLAYSLDKKKDKVQEFTIGFLPHLVLLTVVSGLILCQPDFGTFAILAMITWIMMFVGGVPLKHLLIPLPLVVPAIITYMMSADYRFKRVISFLNPLDDPSGTGYQAIQSMYAFLNGGITGIGFGKGSQKLFYLPEAHTDFIFSMVGEETGFLGVSFIITLYVFMVLRGLLIAIRTENRFGSYLAAGITTTIGIHVCINMCVTLGLMPTKGLTLPFLSYGGTSLVLNMAMIGILMNIERMK